MIFMSGKPIFKDAQMTIRINGEVFDKMKKDAKELNLSMADFVIRLYQGYKEKDDVKSRLEALENVVFQQSRHVA